MNTFQSFIMGGFECADHINRHGRRVNLLRVTEHDIRVKEDYIALKEQGITTVREGICWSACEPRPFVYDFSEVKRRIKTGNDLGIQQIWDICHFGFPDDLSPTHPLFSERFSSLCNAFTSMFKSLSNQPLLVVPINEISFLSWYAGEVRGTVPFAVNSGWDIKYHLCKAAIAGIKTILQLDPNARILTVEPIVHVHPKEGLSYTEEILRHHNYQYQAMDIIAGRICPELGGSEEYLDVLGFNYYHNCQWELEGKGIAWPADSNRCIPLSSLLSGAWNRYRKPFIISETGHFGDGRAQWLKEIIEQCMQILNAGLPLEGICLYPIIDRPDWDNLQWFHNSGLFDIDLATNNRLLNKDYALALAEAQNELLSCFGTNTVKNEMLNEEVLW